MGAEGERERRVEREEDRDPWADLLEQEALTLHASGERRKRAKLGRKLLDKPGCPKGGLPSL